jgi:hypothetical protein
MINNMKVFKNNKNLIFKYFFENKYNDDYNEYFIKLKIKSINEVQMEIIMIIIINSL